jgi:hypothetical protein
MVEAASRVLLFLNLQWDDRNKIMQYDCHQLCPSPLGMQACKSLDPSLVTFGSDVFSNHKNLHVPDSPCFSGDHVRRYEDIISLRKYTCNMCHAFSRLFERDGAEINKNNIAKFSEYCLSKESKDFYSSMSKESE